MILSNATLVTRHHEFIGSHHDVELINPASIDIRIGNSLILEAGDELSLDRYSWENPFPLRPGQFVLVATLERLKVPLDCAVELKLKSSRARQGYNHSLAFWFDPGWDGIGTLELTNLCQRKTLPLYPGLRIGQIIVHKLDYPCTKPYQGRYNGADLVERAKPGN